MASVAPAVVVSSVKAVLRIGPTKLCEKELKVVPERPSHSSVESY